MGLLLRIEKWLENLVERFFGPRESVQPIEIARRMVRVMEDQQRISVNRTYVPNAFDVHVCKEDLVELESIMHTLGQDLANHVKAAAQRQSFAFPGPVTVQFAAETGLSRGETRIVAQFVEGPEESAPNADSPDGTAAKAEAAVQPGDTGRYRPQTGTSVDAAPIDSTQLYKTGRKPAGAWRVVVDEGPDSGADYTVRLPASIGRRQGCDIQLHDPKVSRLHARLEQEADGVVLIDTDSTNGVRLNGRIIRRAQVSAGDRVEIGATRLTIKSAGGE